MPERVSTWFRPVQSDDGTVITSFDRVVPAQDGKPTRLGATETQQFAASLAVSPQEWTRERARAVASRFDQLAPTWDAERGSYRLTPLSDALARGGPWRAGLCIEVGAGTGLLTSLLEKFWNPVLCVDLSTEMLRQNRHGLRVRADAAGLPVPDGAAAAIVLGDVPLFAGEVVRTLARGGAVVWCNALGDDAPYHVPTATLVAALSAFGTATWSAVDSNAGWGTWAVLRPDTEASQGHLS